MLVRLFMVTVADNVQLEGLDVIVQLGNQGRFHQDVSSRYNRCVIEVMRSNPYSVVLEIMEKRFVCF